MQTRFGITGNVPTMKARSEVVSVTVNRMRTITVRKLCFVAVMGVVLLASCNTDRDQPMVLNSREVRDDFALTAFSDAGYRIFIQPERRSREGRRTGKLEIVDASGVRFAEGSLWEGRLSGPFVTWHTNGQINSFQYYDGGEINGTEAYWSESGALIRSTAYINGRKQGLEAYWLTNGFPHINIIWDVGTPVAVDVFENGILVKSLAGAEAEQYGRRGARPTP